MTAVRNAHERAGAFLRAHDMFNEADQEGIRALAVQRTAYAIWTGGSTLSADLENAAEFHALEPLPKWARKIIDEVTTSQWDAYTGARAAVTAAETARAAALAVMAAEVER